MPIYLDWEDIKGSKMEIKAVVGMLAVDGGGSDMV